MFTVQLYRNTELQDSIDVGVMKPADEMFFKHRRVQIDMDDRTYDVAITAKLPNGGKEVTIMKNGRSMAEAFHALANECFTTLQAAN